MLVKRIKFNLIEGFNFESFNKYRVLKKIKLNNLFVVLMMKIFFLVFISFIFVKSWLIILFAVLFEKLSSVDVEL